MSDLSILPGTPKGSAYLFAHLLRSLRIAQRKAISDHMHVELAGSLVPCAAKARSGLEFFLAVCARLAVQPTSQTKAGDVPITVAFPQAVCDAYGFPRTREHDDGFGLGPGYHGVPWLDIVARIELEHLLPLLARAPVFFVSFASEYVEGDDRRQFVSDLSRFAWVDAPERRFAVVDFGRAFRPRRWTVALRTLSPLAHGGDTQGSNVASLRVQEMVDAFTGKAHEIPFVSGGAVRGCLRDALMLDWLDRVGVGPRDIASPALAHALFSGGDIEKGAVMGVSDNPLRDAIREVCPPADLFGGNLEGQLMQGQAVIGDAVLACEQTAWLVGPALGWTMEEAKARASELPDALEASVERMSTRNHHEDLPGKSLQMIMHTHAIAPGHILAWSFSLRAGRLATSLQRSTMAHAVALLMEQGRLGAKGQAGFGQVEWGPVEGEDLPSAQVYLDHVAAHAERARAWLTGQVPLVAKPEPAPAAEVAEKPAKKAGKGGRNAA